MKKNWFYFAATFLMGVICISIIMLMFTGKGCLMSFKIKAMADNNKDNIKAFERQLPTGRAELDYSNYEKGEEKAFNHIYVDGIKCDFPLKLSELPEQFTWCVKTVYKNGDSTGNNNYSYKVNLYYNDVLWAWGYYYDNSNNYFPEDIVITTLLLYANEGTEYVPEIIVAGFNAAECNVEDVNNKYGYVDDNSGYQSINVPTEDKEAFYRMYVGIANDGVGISRLEYVNEPYKIGEEKN